MKKNVYIAGKLFKAGDIKERLHEENVLKEIGYENVFNPISQPFNEDKDAALPTAESIFKGDTSAVLESDIILAELDDEDPGVCMELGIAYGVNYMLSLLRTIDSDSNPEIVKALVLKITELMPKKKVYAHLTDIRVGSSGEYDGHNVPFGINQYVAGGISEMGKIYTDKDEMFKDMGDVNV